MRHNSCDYTVFIFDVLHAAADAVKGKNEGLCPPKPQKGAEEGKVEDEVANIRQMFFLIMFLE